MGKDGERSVDVWPRVLARGAGREEGMARHGMDGRGGGEGKAQPKTCRFPPDDIDKIDPVFHLFKRAPTSGQASVCRLPRTQTRTSRVPSLTSLSHPQGLTNARIHRGHPRSPFSVSIRLPCASRLYSLAPNSCCQIQTADQVQLGVPHPSHRLTVKLRPDPGATLEQLEPHRSEISNLDPANAVKIAI